MRQLKGKVKETPKQKRERREDFQKQKSRVLSIVLPTLGVICALIVAYVYFQSRPTGPKTVAS
jgi:cell division septal protein FtsQ